MASTAATTWDLEEYLAASVEKIIRDMVKAAAFHPSEAQFMAKFALAGRRAARRRQAAAQRGEHVPPFLIASITSLCNLHCAGCYARSLEICADGTPVEQMTAEEWEAVFAEARDLGVGFILLAGGEPMVRWDVIQAAARYPEILFPVFTNGTMLSDAALDYMERHRNLLPVLSVEGGEERTDRRRGAGVYDRIRRGIRGMQSRRIAFAASVTVTRENLTEVLSDDFLSQLAKDGCKGVVYVEYVPTHPGTEVLAPDDKDRERMARRLDRLRAEGNDMVLISFPGDEKSSGGCLAAGRGFFHINSHGGAEPCPFSPYSDVSVRSSSLREAMDSTLFRGLRSGDFLLEDHTGGCVLYEKRAQVEALLRQTSPRRDQEAVL